MTQLSRLGLVASALLACATLARAQNAVPQLSGNWHAGVTTIDAAIESWGVDCGARPQSSKTSGGGLVKVTQDGKVLVIEARDQALRSDACWSRNPAMRKQSSSYVDGVWTTRCKTAPNDPREEQGTYTLKLLGPDTLLYQDVSRYNWALKDSRCIATFTTAQTLTRAQGSAAQTQVSATQPTSAQPTSAQPTSAQPTSAQPTREGAPAPPQTTTPSEPQERACTPGAPHHLNLRPRRVDLEIGQRVCLRARVSDAADCLVANAQVSYSLVAPKGRKAELEGSCFKAADSAAEGEGEFRVLASSGTLRSEAVIAVRAVDLSALIAKRVETGGLSGFETLDAPARAVPTAAARVSTRQIEPVERGFAWTPAMLALAAVAAGAALVWVSRRRRRTTAEPTRTYSAEATEGPPQAPPAVAPSAPVAAPPAPQPAAEPWICPLCRRGYPAEQGRCPRDGSTLMPYAEFNARAKSTDTTRQRRCPECGERFPANTTFCGKDGKPLVDA